MNSSEDKGINSLKYFLQDGYVRTTYLNSGEKEPLWDGSLYVYKDLSLTKNGDLLFRVPTQVKAKVVSKKSHLSKNEIFEWIPKKSLEKYLAEDGVVYVKVLYYSKEFFQIFYNSILSIKGKDILKKFPGDKVKVRLQSINNRVEFEGALHYFNENRKLQPNNFVGEFEIDELKKGQVVAIDAREFDINKENYDSIHIYKVDNGKKYPLENGVLSFSGRVDWEIRINDKVYFESVKTRNTNKGKTFFLGDIIQFKEIELDSYQIFPDYTSKYLQRLDKTIEESILNFVFYSDLLQAKKVSVGPHEFNMSNSIGEGWEKEYETILGLLAVLETTKFILQKLGKYSKEIKLQELQNARFGEFIISHVKKVPVAGEWSEAYSIVQLGDNEVKVHFDFNENGEYIVTNFE